MAKMIILQIEDNDEELYNQIINLIKESKRIVKDITHETDVGVLTYPGLRIERYGYRVYLGNTEVKLSSFEFKLLYFLASSPGQVFTKEQIYQYLYNDEGERDSKNSIYCLVKSIRKKLNDSSTTSKYIRTIRGIGYKFCEEVL